MNVKITEKITNISVSIAANIFSMLFSVIMILVAPKIIGVEGYGSWQLYIFYITLGAWFQFGWVDGVFLRYAGILYDDINKNKISTQFWLLWLFEVIIASLIFSALIYLWHDENKVYIAGAACLGNIILTPRALILYVLQITNRIKTYAVNTILEKIFFFIFLILFFFIYNKFNFVYIIISDLLAKALSLGCLMIICGDLVFAKLESIVSGIKEAYENISVGVKLMLANMASILILSIIRWGISEGWDLATFGKVSLTLSISNFFMVFISAVSVVLFPILKRTEEKNLSKIYAVLRECLAVASLGLLIVYYPLSSALAIWLPQYADRLFYMAVLFPICLFESRVSLLINTYLKTLRQERLMLIINSIAVVVSLVCTIITVYWLHNLNLAVLSIVLVFAFRCILAEYFLGRLLKLKLMRDVLLEIVMVVCFIGLNWSLDNWWAAVLYMVIYTLYLILKKDNLYKSISIIKTYICE